MQDTKRRSHLSTVMMWATRAAIALTLGHWWISETGVPDPYWLWHSINGLAALFIFACTWTTISRLWED